MLIQFLSQTAGDVPLWAIKEAVKKRDVRIDGVRVERDVRLNAGQEVRVYWPKSVVAAQKKEKILPAPEVVYEDGHVLLINKPQGIPSQNEENPWIGDSALTRVNAYLEKKGCTTDQLHLCHRLDVQTGGLLLFALSYAGNSYRFCNKKLHKEI